jgi:hypothetical protein
MIRNTHAALIMAVAALALSGCGEKAGVEAKNESAESVANKVAASNIKPRPGRWESSMRLEKMGVAGLPPQAKDAMARQQGMTQTFSSCLTPEQAERPNGGFFQKGASGCTYDRFTMAGGRVDGEMTCKQGSGPQKVRMNGSYSEDSYNIAIASEGEMQPGMKMSMAMTISARRTGECTGKEDS